MYVYCILHILQSVCTATTFQKNTLGKTHRSVWFVQHHLERDFLEDEKDRGCFDPFISLTQNKTSFRLSLTCWDGKQKQGMEGGERGRRDMSSLSDWGRTGPTSDMMTSDWNIFRPEGNNTTQFISLSLSTLLFLPSFHKIFSLGVEPFIIWFDHFHI